MKKNPENNWWKRLVLIQAFCLFIANGFAQDTLSLFYANGEYKLSPVNKELLREFIFSHNLRDLDSLWVLGSTDSTGNARKNRKLSMRRADNALHFSRELIPGKIHYQVFSLGEESEAERPRINHRRVELILYGKNYFQPEEHKSVRPANSTTERGTCYRVYDSVMLNSYLSSYKRGATDYFKVRIPSYALPVIQLYSMSPSSLQVRPLKWKTEKMGVLWWQQTVYTTLVKERDWNTYGLLVKATNDSLWNCVVCEYDLSSPVFSYSPSPDVGVMQYCQVYKRPLTKHQTLLVPSEFVNVNLPYYFDEEQDYPVRWYQQKGRVNGAFYFAEIPEQLKDSNVVIFSTHRHCNDSVKAFSPRFTTTVLKHHTCSSASNTHGGYYYFGFELGFRNSGYAGMFMGYQFDRLNIAYTLGVDYLAQLQQNASLDLTLWSVSAVKTSEYVGRNSQSVHDFHPLLWLYAGAGTARMHALRTSDRETTPNVHLGFAYKQPYMPWKLERAFVEGGVAYRITPETNNVKPYFRVGLRLKI